MKTMESMKSMRSRPQNISTVETGYLDRLEELYDHIEEYRNRV